MFVIIAEVGVPVFDGADGGVGAGVDGGGCVAHTGSWGRMAWMCGVVGGVRRGMTAVQGVFGGGLEVGRSVRVCRGGLQLLLVLYTKLAIIAFSLPDEKQRNTVLVSRSCRPKSKALDKGLMLSLQVH